MDHPITHNAVFTRNCAITSTAHWMDDECRVEQSLKLLAESSAWTLQDAELPIIYIYRGTRAIIAEMDLVCQEVLVTPELAYYFIAKKEDQRQH